MDKIGPYQIIEIIHRGPQQLFRARGKDGGEVAIKAIPVAGLAPESRERFTREALTCRGLTHPNLICVYEMGEADGMLFQAMEMLEGADLGKVMAEGRHFDWDGRLDIMEQVSNGLQYAHEHHLVHRDIKPANIFIENSGRVRVLDFGMVRVAESQLTKIGSSLGTLNYMAPEQIRGERCTPATDVFSAAIVFFQLATGRHPFSARDRSLGQVVSAIVFETPPKLSDLAPGAPEGLEFILNRALEKDPAKRPQNAGDLKDAIGLCRLAGQFAAPPPAPAVGPASRPVHPAQDADKTRVMVRPSAPVPAGDDKTKVLTRPSPAPAPPPFQPPAVAGDDKTRVLKRPLRATVDAPLTQPPAVSEGDDKTRVLKRPLRATVDAPLPPPPAKPQPAAVPQPAQLPHLRYCPACTFANPPAAAICQSCQTPFPAMAPAALAPKPSPWPLYAAISVAALLAIALVAVLLMK